MNKFNIMFRSASEFHLADVLCQHYVLEIRKPAVLVTEFVSDENNNLITVWYTPCREADKLFNGFLKILKDERIYYSTDIIKQMLNRLNK